jgi:hypothetical protein
MKRFQNLFLVSIVLFLASCTGSENPHDHSNEEGFDKAQAIAIHEESGIVARQFQHNLVEQFSVTPPSDSTFNLLAGIDARFFEWKKTLVKLPGTECNHAPGEEHHHDHAAEAALEELSDEQLHELQLAIRAELDIIICDFNKIVGKEDC